MARRTELERALEPPATAYEKFLRKQKNRTERLWEEATGRCWRCREPKPCECEEAKAA